MQPTNGPSPLGTSFGGTPLQILSFFGDTHLASGRSSDRVRVWVGSHLPGNKTAAVNGGFVCDGFSRTTDLCYWRGRERRRVVCRASQIFKFPHLRNAYTKVGMFGMLGNFGSGFGFSYDGSVGTLFRFVAGAAFNFPDTATERGSEAFMLQLDND